MTYRAPTAEMTFFAAKIVGQDRLADTTMFADATAETRAAIIEEAARLSEEVLAPLNGVGDLHPARLENGVVRSPPGYAEGYAKIAEGGWVGISAAPEHGGMGLPQSITTIVNEMLASSCLSLSLNPLMTQGQIEALEHHGSDELKALYLPKLTSGTWTGTMNLTEPQAGSDVGALTTKAEPNGDGSYAITGQKIYISWGDHDLAENICHLVLARLPDGVPGTKGISLFIVPKYIPDAQGKPGVANSLRAISLEHKLGLHGSPTAVMGYDRATGWLVGEAHNGMACMFTMMNNARLGVGVEGLGVAEAATQKAIAYAKDRRQGRTPSGSESGSILGHADVRRMVMAMKTQTQVARAICYDCAFSLDMAQAAEGDERERHAKRGAFLTPIAKAFGTDTGIEVASTGMQVHGGMGFIEETGAAQYLRDVRVTAIYEGTNGIQAMDLVGRKLSMDRGATARSVIAEITATAAELAAAGQPFAKLAEATIAAAEASMRATEWMLEAPTNDRNAGAAPYLRLLALALGAHYLGRGALLAADTAEAEERRVMAAFFAGHFVPQTAGLAETAMLGADLLYALDEERLSA